MRLEIDDIHKYYGSKKANAGISVTIEPGKIHGILGENGAGKSTLMKVLSGYTAKTRGTIRIDGRIEDYHTPAAAARLGIGMLYQDPLDFAPMTLLENFMIGQASGLGNRAPFFRRQFASLNAHFNFSLDPDESVRRLTVGGRQQLEIMRLLALGTRVLILDEPTTGITSEQKASLFRALKQLATDGKSVIMVSHKLEDAEVLCDTVTVLREGVVTGSMRQPYRVEALLEMMFDVPPLPPTRTAVAFGKPLLSVRNVSVTGGRSGLSDCTVSVRQGEMIGLAGLEGSGQGLFLRLAAGIKKPLTGAIDLFGQAVDGKDHHAFRRAGVVFLPTSRLEEGLMPGLTIHEHFALQDRTPGVFVRWHEALQICGARIDKFRIDGHPKTTVENLSGGNQQRLLLSMLSKQSRLLLLEQPTRGLDVESAHWVWRHLHRYCRRKTAIVFSSSELDEIMMVADRVLVFYNGRIVKDAKKEETTVAELSGLIAGKGSAVLQPAGREPGDALGTG